MFIKHVQGFGKPRTEELVWDLFCTKHDKYTVGLGVFFFLSRNDLMMEEKITNSLNEMFNFSCKKVVGPLRTFRLIIFKGRLMFLIHGFYWLVPASLESHRSSSINCTGPWYCQGPHMACEGNFRVILTCR